jgi:hypothetical protein
MFAKWAYGFIQSKDRYISQQEVLDIAHRYPAQHIPMDVIVQDWFWWIVWVAPGHGGGETIESKIDHVVQYDGRHISIQAP